MPKVKRVWLRTGREVRVYGAPQPAQFYRLIKESNAHRFRFLLPCQEVITKLVRYDEEKRKEKGCRGEIEFGYVTGSLWVVDAWDLTHRQLVIEVPDCIGFSSKWEECADGIIWLDEREGGECYMVKPMGGGCNADLLARSVSLRTALSKLPVFYLPLHTMSDTSEALPLEWKEPNQPVDPEET